MAGKPPAKVPSPEQTIAQAKKNLATTGPDAKAHPAIVKSRPKPREHDVSGGLKAQYENMTNGSSMW